MAPDSSGAPNRPVQSLPVAAAMAMSVVVVLILDSRPVFLALAMA
jgi:hypothetical protein